MSSKNNDLALGDLASSAKLDLAERGIGNLAVPHAAGGAWSFSTYGARVEHVNYQNATSIAGHIAPILGLGMTNRGTGGNFVGGGGGYISSTTREWCRFVARRGSLQTFSSQGGCELALRDGGPLLVANVIIGGKNQEFLLFNPESGISQLKVTADLLVGRYPPDIPVLLLFLLAFVVAIPFSIILSLLIAIFPSLHLYKVWKSKRKYLANEEQITQGIAIVSNDFGARGVSFG